MMLFPECPYPGCKEPSTYVNGKASAYTCKQHSWCSVRHLRLTNEHMVSPPIRSQQPPGPGEVDWESLSKGCALLKLRQVHDMLPALRENKATKSVARKLETILEVKK